MREPEVVNSPIRFPQEFSRSMQRAADRCADISRSELVLGYMMTYRAYSEIAEECKTLSSWLFQEITRMDAASCRWPSFDDAA